MNPNPQQQAAIDSGAAATFVIAGPGSGKTSVLVKRIERLFTQQLLPDVVVLTFTNSGAREITKRITKGEEEVEYIGTLHGYCYQLINRFGHLIGYRREGNVTIVDEQASETFLKQTMEKLRCRTSLKQIRLTRDNPKGDARLVWLEYLHTLKRQNMIDYDRILQDGLALMQIEEVREAIQCDELLVDEAQDSGETDWAIYNAFPAKSRFIVGDFDQSIFSFRGARPDLFNTAVAFSPGATTYVLESNYRANRHFCELANRLIEKNAHRPKKQTIAADSARDGVVDYSRFEDQAAELRHLGMRLHFRHEQGIDWREMAVLSRNNYEANQAMEYCRAAGIPVAERVNALPRDWRQAMTLLSWACDPMNELLASQVLRDRGQSEVDIADRVRQCRVNQNPIVTCPGVELVSPDFLLATNDITQESIDRVLAAKALLPETATLADLVHSLWRPEETTYSEGVTFSTIHGAKGREWDVVMVIGMEEGVLPGRGDIEEERRLAFVAITRARHYLSLSSVERRRTQWGQEVKCQPSRFLEEML